MASPAFAALIHVMLWVALAVAFGLVAKRCGSAHRGVAITAWLTCAAACLAPVPWGLVLFVGYVPRLNYILQAPAFLALFAFGVAARPFGARWSISSMIAGLLGLVALLTVVFVLGTAGFISRGLNLVWLLPLFILGIAMCRTRIPPPQPGH